MIIGDEFAREKVAPTLEQHGSCQQACGYLLGKAMEKLMMASYLIEMHQPAVSMLTEAQIYIDKLTEFHKNQLADKYD